MLSVASLRRVTSAPFPARGVRGLSLPPSRRPASHVKGSQLRKADQWTSASQTSPRAPTPSFAANDGRLPAWTVSPTHAVTLLMAANVFVAWRGVDVNSKSDKEKAAFLVGFITSDRHMDMGLYQSLVMPVFTHSLGMHIAVNTLGIYVFGRSLAPLLGFSRLIGVYVTSGAAGLWMEVQRQKHKKKQHIVFGGNGAVGALAALNIALVPHQTFKLLGALPVRIKSAGVALIGFEALRWLASDENRGAVAGLGGAAVGAAYGLHLRRLMRLYR